MDEKDDILWWSHGGRLHGESPARLRFLHRILQETPGLGLKACPGAFDETVGVPDHAGFDPQGPSCEIHYYGFGRPSYRWFRKPEGETWKAEIIDTWGMTITDAGTFSGTVKLPLPGREYIAVRLTRV